LSIGNLEKRFSETYPAFIARDPERQAKELHDVAAGLEKAVTDLENYDRAEAYATDLFIQRQEVLASTQDSFNLVENVKDRRKEMERLATGIFQKPAKAMEAFDTRRREVGTKNAVIELSKNPKVFGKTTGRGFLGRGDTRFKGAVAGLRHAGNAYVEAVGEVSSKRQVIDTDLTARFDKTTNATLKTARDNLKDIDRLSLQKAVRDAAAKVKVDDLAKLPFRTRLRAEVITNRVNDLRADQSNRDKALNDGLSVGPNYRRWPSMPFDALPSEARAFDAADKYAKARHKIVSSTPWRNSSAKVTPSMFTDLRSAAQNLSKEGRPAEKFYRGFKIDKRTLEADSAAGASRQAQGRSNKRLSSFLNSKSPKIRIRFTSILRLLGVPMPRIPIPRVPRMSIKARGRGMVRELAR
jgi:hypothetical protein